MLRAPRQLCARRLQRSTLWLTSTLWIRPGYKTSSWIRVVKTTTCSTTAPPLGRVTAQRPTRAHACARNARGWTKTTSTFVPRRCSGHRVDAGALTSGGRECSFVDLPWVDPLDRPLLPGFAFGTSDCVSGYMGFENEDGSYGSCHLSALCSANGRWHTHSCMVRVIGAEIMVPNFFERYSVTLIVVGSLTGFFGMIGYWVMKRRIEARCVEGCCVHGCGRLNVAAGYDTGRSLRRPSGDGLGGRQRSHKNSRLLSWHTSAIAITHTSNGAACCSQPRACIFALWSPDGGARTRTWKTQTHVTWTRVHTST